MNQHTEPVVIHHNETDASIIYGKRFRNDVAVICHAKYGQLQSIEVECDEDISEDRAVRIIARKLKSIMPGSSSDLYYVARFFLTHGRLK